MILFKNLTTGVESVKIQIFCLRGEINSSQARY
jgi:hypothetical protein